MERTAVLETEAAYVEVIKGKWPEKDEFEWSVASPMVTMLFEASGTQCEGRYKQEFFGYRPFGKIFVAVPHRLMCVRHAPGPVRAVRCVFKPALYDRVGIDWQPLDNQQLDRTLDIRRPRADQIIRMMMQESMNPELAGTEFLDAMAAALLLECARNIYDDDKVSEKREERGFGRRQMQLIDAHLSSDSLGVTSVSEIAHMLGYNPKYLSQVFRAYTGRSIGQYIKASRLQRASGMLAETALPLKEIAYRLGFANPANFSAAFKKEMRMTPGEFRKRG